jgi:hypothetical protein
MNFLKFLLPFFYAYFSLPFFFYVLSLLWLCLIRSNFELIIYKLIWLKKPQLINIFLKKLITYSTNHPLFLIKHKHLFFSSLLHPLLLLLFTLHTISYLLLTGHYTIYFFSSSLYNFFFKQNSKILDTKITIFIYCWIIE